MWTSPDSKDFETRYPSCTRIDPRYADENIEIPPIKEFMNPLLKASSPKRTKSAVAEISVALKGLTGKG